MRWPPARKRSNGYSGFKQRTDYTTIGAICPRRAAGIRDLFAACGRPRIRNELHNQNARRYDSGGRQASREEGERMKNSEAASSTRIGAINGLRGCAILMVVLHHLFIPYTAARSPHPGEIDITSFFAAFINHAWLGVQIFFVLSGFVLYLPYCTKKRRMTTAADMRAFYLHRARRLMPLYFIVVLVTMGLHSSAVVGSRNWYLELGGLLSTLFTFSPHGFMPPSNVVLWSVSVEIWFSLLFPFLVLMIARFSIVKVTLASIVICAGFATIGGSIPVARTGGFMPFTHGLFAACYQFIFGMLACRLFVDGLQNQAAMRRNARFLVPGAGVTGLAGYAILFDLEIGIAGLLFTAGFSALLLGVIARANPLAALLEVWPLQILGCMCYSIYAWHGIIMNEMIPAEPSHLADTLRLLAPYLVITLGLSALSYRYIEFGHQRDARALFLMPTADPTATGRAVDNR
jgi:peptidoglycan/LPS O-acetylase OafA/YrhL